jgi:hypothetical protein
MPTVVNRHHFHGQPLPKPSLYIGRGTPLGNPFTVAEHGDDALRLFRLHLSKAVEERRYDVLAAINSITPNHYLICSCAPRPCHGDIVLELWEWLAGKGEF